MAEAQRETQKIRETQKTGETQKMRETKEERHKRRDRRGGDTIPEVPVPGRETQS
jgi:hypothetical protein